MKTHFITGPYARVSMSGALALLLAACGPGNSDSAQQTGGSGLSSAQASRFAPETIYGATTTIVAEHSGKCLDVRGGPQATQDGALIEQWSCSTEANQDWNLNSKGNGNYELIARSSGKCIEPISGATANGTNIQQAACDGSSKQLWQVRPKSTAGRYEIVHASANRCLDVTGGPTATADGIYTELWDCTGQANQSWVLTVPTSQPSPSALPVVAKHSDKCLSIRGGETATQNGILAEQASCVPDAPYQAWTVKDMGNGLNELIVKHSGKCLTVRDSNSNNEAYIQQTTCTGGANQLWRQDSTAVSGEYVFKTALAGGRCLDVRGGPQATQDGARLELWDCTGQNNQIWKVGSSGVTPPVPVPSIAIVGPANTQDFSQTFVEEFNGNTLDETKWQKGLWYARGQAAGSFRVNNGYGEFTGNAANMFTGRNDTNYSILTTDSSFKQKFGVFQARIKMPAGKGYWPAFWTFDHPSGYRPEIDIFEAYPGGQYDWTTGSNPPRPNRADVTIHPKNDADTNMVAGDNFPIANNVDLSADFHTYTLVWDQGFMDFYFDGQLVKRVSNPDTLAWFAQFQQYVIVGLGINYGVSGGPSSDPAVTPTGFGSDPSNPPLNVMRVDYVAAWQWKKYLP